MNHQLTNSGGLERACLVMAIVLGFALSCFGLIANADHHGANQTASSDLAPIVEGAGSYSRTISTESPEAQAYFDQGLRLSLIHI